MPTRDLSGSERDLSALERESSGPKRDAKTVMTEINEDYLKGRPDMTRNIPVGRLGETRDLDGALLLLASDASRFMAGATIVVDGGQVLAIAGTDTEAIARHVGFLGVHDGRTSNFVFLDFWADENELHHHVFVSPIALPDQFTYVTPTGLSASGVGQTAVTLSWAASRDS